MVIQCSWCYRTELFLKLLLFAPRKERGKKKKKLCYHVIVNTPSPELEGSRSRCNWEDIKMAVPHTAGTWMAPGSFAA